MLILTTTDDTGESTDRMLARFESDGKLYVSAHHWTRGWYQRAVEHPDVSVEIDGAVSDYTEFRCTAKSSSGSLRDGRRLTT